MNFIQRPLGRSSYFWAGCSLMAIKYNLDRAVARVGFHRDWYFWNYIKPHGFAAIDAVPPADERFYFILLLTSLPFLFIGIVLTLRRLRSAGLPASLCLLFFVPVINLIFFVVLSLLPGRDDSPVLRNHSNWFSWLPTGAVESALASTVTVGLAGMGLSRFSVQTIGSYGWGLFVALPFAMGLVSVLIYARSSRRTFGSCMLVAILPVIFCGAGLFVAAVEGAICLVMAAPIGIALALFGGMVGYTIVNCRGRRMSPVAMLLTLLSVPLTMGMEKRFNEAPPLLSLTSSVVIDAPPEAVWRNLISFSPIPPERDWILHTGVAYPTRARIEGHGVGAIRHCIFSTGEFIEPIEAWDEPHRLRFSVSDQPEPMEEMSPYPHLKTPHLDGYFQSHEGELRLMELPGQKTRLEGTTWYTDRIWPGAYWRLWSDLLIHHIHLRVLNHIKNLSEHASVMTP